jgi:peptide/nickel transport system substrate-binding protein
MRARRRPSLAFAATATAAVALLASGCGKSLSSATSGSTAGDLSPTAGLVATSPVGTQPVAQVTWALYRDVDSLDPAFAFDYPENTAISLMCESLLRQEPNGTIAPGLATVSTPTPTSVIFTIRKGATFWDGHPVTPADVVYSLQRQEAPALGGFYGQVFDRVKSIAATGSDQVTLTLSQPDYWLEGELSSMAGVIIEKAYAVKEGKNYGTPAGGIMCTGDYELSSWSPATGVVATANPHYWNGPTPMTKQIILKGVADNNALTAGLETGSISGTFVSGGEPTLPQLRASKAVKVYQGPGEATDAMIISATSGPLTNVKVRQALSLAVNRQAVIDNVYMGAALPAKWLTNPGTFGYGTSTLDQMYNAAPSLKQNVAEAKKLVQQAGATGQTITIGTSQEMVGISYEAGVYEQAAQAIGLKVAFKNVSAQDFINFFTDPNFRKGVDMFPTTNYGDYAGPEGLLETLALPGGSQNYDNFNDPKITQLMDQSRSTADPVTRAKLMAEAEQEAAVTLPWIPTCQPTTITVMNAKLTGATTSFSYMFAPWAASLGGTS